MRDMAKKSLPAAQVLTTALSIQYFGLELNMTFLTGVVLVCHQLQLEWRVVGQAMVSIIVFLRHPNSFSLWKVLLFLP